MHGRSRQRELFSRPVVMGRADLPDQNSLKNHLLRAMSHADFAMLEPGLVEVDLVRAQELVHPGETIAYCWFLDDGIASIVAMSSAGHETEAGIVGREGMVDPATILGVATSPNRCFIQIPGCGYRLPAPLLGQCLTASVDARALFNGFAHSLFAQVASTALANAAFTVEQRLARWLLMCSDRLDEETIALTHDFLSVMLNVRRAGVTNAIRSLQDAGLLKAGRGAITIADRPALLRLVGDGYSPIARG